MEKRKSLKAIALILCFMLCLTLSLAFTACADKEGEVNEAPVEEGEKLPIPAEIKIDENGLVTWKRVNGAASYDVLVNQKEYNVKFTRYNLYETEEKPDDGKFSVSIRTVSKDGVKGDWSEKLSYTISGGNLLHPVIIGVENGIISWFGNEDATSTIVKVNGTEDVLSSSVTEYDLSSYSGASLTFSVRFSGDGVYYSDSAESIVIYYPNTGKAQLPAPKNVRMEGQTLKFDEVIGADTYYLRDYNNTVVSVNTNEIDMSSRYLTKFVSAGISSGAYMDSEEASVGYFGEGSGEGTKASPFVITTQEEFRYIEFFEGIGEAKYYELGNDIAFEEIELKDDEFGSNAYKLGSFSGVLDGKGYALQNMKVYYRDGYSALFSSINKDAIIKNVVFDNASFRTWTVKSNDGIMHEKGGEVAVLANTNRGSIINVRLNNSSVTAVIDGAAGLVTINRGEINGCYIGKGTSIFGNRESGGIATYNEGTIANCKNFGSIGGNVTIGGIVARNAGVVVSSENSGKVSGIKRVGGIVGYNYNVKLDGEYEFGSEIRYCSNAGEIIGSTVIGGIVGQNGSDGTEDVSALSVAGAGIFACYNVGAVKGGSVLGGIVGNNFATESGSRGVKGCYNAGSVTADKTATGEYKRIFVDATACSWVSGDGARMYCHYWGSSSSVWPGVMMNGFSLGERNYYYVDINVETVKGIKFSRCGYSGEVFNSTADLTLTEGTTMYNLASDFSGEGSWTAPGSVSENLPAVAGAIAGYNAKVDDCYYVTGTATAPAHSNGSLQNNTISINGIAAPAQAQKSLVEINSDSFISHLNSLSGGVYWKKGTEHAVFVWQ